LVDFLASRIELSRLASTVKSLLKLQIGPVQDFIAQARKTQDLWAGSWLLSHLTRFGVNVVKNVTGAELLYPLLNETVDKFAASTPNLFLARVPSEQAADTAKLAESAIRAEWKRIADSVHQLLSKNAAKGWDVGWLQQVERFLTVDWIIHPCGDASVALAMLEKKEPPLPIGAPDFKKHDACLDGLHIALAEWKFAARKNARGFTAWKGRSVSKDHLDGFRDVMGGDEHEAFWNGLRCEARFKYALSGQQLYGALTLIKRLFVEPILGDRPGFISVQHIAAAIDAEEDDVPPFSPTYYAILAMDGDDMGQWVSGCKGVHGDLDPLQPGYQGKLSSKLSAFAAAVPAIMESHAGQAIYCGGDDVLAMLPAARALKCAGDLATVFSQILPGSTASVGIAIGHVRAPLQDTIQAAREAEKSAKAMPGKNAFCLRILKRSGEHVQIAARWDSGAMLVWDELSQMSTSGIVSGRFAHRYAALLQPLLITTHGWESVFTDELREAAEAELLHVLCQQAGKNAKEALKSVELWRPCLNSLSPRDYLHFWLAWAFLCRIDDLLENSHFADS
jgi:CRISPR-associated protein Cmr2